MPTGTTFTSVVVNTLDSDGNSSKKFPNDIKLSVTYDPQGISLICYNGKPPSHT